MKNVRLFLALSDQFAWARNELELYMRQVNQVCSGDPDADVKSAVCDAPALCFTPEGLLREEYDRILRESDMAVFLFGSRQDPCLQTLYRAAAERMRPSVYGRTEVFAYYGAPEAGETAAEELLAFLEEAEQYHASFRHIDTVKFRILLQLSALLPRPVYLDTSKGFCRAEDSRLIPLENVSEFANRVLRRSPWDDDGVFLPEEEKVFAVSLRMSLDDVRGGLTPAQKQAYRSYELGDDWQAIRVLSGEFFADEASLRQQEAPDRKAVASLVRRGRQLIAMLAATNDMHRFLDIRSVFRLIIDYALKADVELDAVYEYIYQWADGNRDPEAILLAQKLLGKQSYCADPENKAPLLFLAARFMLKADRYEEATAYYEEAKALLLPMIAEDYPYAYQYSKTCSALAGLYMKAARFEDAYAVCEEAVRVWRGPAEAEPEKYLPYAAGAYYQLGVFFEKTGRRQEADAAYAEALALAEKDPDSYGCREIIEALS